MRTIYFELIDNVFCSLVDREEANGPDSISDIERVVLTIWHASGIIGNGGFRYFFECGLPARATATAYARIGVDQAESILRNVLNLFPNGIVPEDYDERMAIVDEIYIKHADLLDRLEGEYYATDPVMERQLAGWIRVHKDVFCPSS